MTGENGTHDDLIGVLMLPHLPPPQPKVKIDKADMAFRIAIIHKMSIDDRGERKDAKYLKEQKFIDTGDEKCEERKQVQMIAASRIEYWKSALEAAKKAARSACEQDLGNIKYLKFLAELEQIVI